LGIDGVSLFFIVLTTFIIPFCILTLDNNLILDKIAHIICILFLECLLLLSFSVIDLFLFFICFEAAIIPMYIIMKRGSQAQKIKASYYFIIYTLLGSLPLFIGILFICSALGTTNINVMFLSHTYFFFKYQNVLW
jgi:NADH:ubiquinone oxidoreductase subunit 4 (subunit M)